MSLQQFDEILPLLSSGTFGVTTGANTAVAALTTATSRNRYDAFYLTNSDTVAHTVNLSVANAAVPAIISVSVPAGAGTNGTAPVEAFSSSMPTGQQQLIVPPSTTLYLTVNEATTVDGQIGAVLVGGTI